MANQLNWRDKIKFSSGDTIEVHQKVEEGDKTRTQTFEGVVTRIKGNPGTKSFTVRKIGANKVGVEKIFPEDTPTVTDIKVVKRGKVRRANLSYLRDKATKKEAKIKDRFVKADEEEEEGEDVDQGKGKGEGEGKDDEFEKEEKQSEEKETKESKEKNEEKEKKKE